MGWRATGRSSRAPARRGAGVVEEAEFGDVVLGRLPYTVWWVMRIRLM
jgi:hypothetical protein